MKAVIFDFDGTVADNFQFVHEIVSKLAPIYGFSQEDADEVVQMRDKSLAEIVQKYHVSRFKVLRMLIDSRKEMRRYLAKTKMPAGMRELFEKLDSEGTRLAIVSSNSNSSIEEFLKNNGVKVNIEIYSSLHLFGKAKPIEKYMKKHSFTRSEVVYVGDELRDIESANEAGIPIISVTWGYNSAEVLRKNNDTVAENTKELLTQIESIAFN